MTVTKRNGNLETLDISKITESLTWAKNRDKLTSISISDIEVASNLHFYDKMETAEIHDIMISVVKSLSSLRTMDMDTLARNLILQKVYKETYNCIKPYTLHEIIKINTKLKIYNSKLLSKFNEKEMSLLDAHIDHSRDFTFSTAGLEQLVNKYIIKSKDGLMLESPQAMYMAISMDVFRDYPNRIYWIKFLYDALSTFKISFPTPMMKALRTKSTDYASCIAIMLGDSIDSWTAGKSAIMKHTVASAGIGVDISSVASINDNVKNGLIKHSGKIPLLRAIDADIQTSSQNGRRGQAVSFINFFDPEIESILALKSPRTASDLRINDMKYTIKMNELLYSRANENKYISLFSSRKQKHLVSLFDSKNTNAFIDEYERLEEAGLEDGKILAQEFFNIFTSERFENGIYYIMNMDESNNNSAYKEGISQSNICLEFMSPTKPVISGSEEPDIGVCILTNINQGTVSIEELSLCTELVVRALNNIVHRQIHPTAQANAFVRDYTSLGIGFANHAYFVAKTKSRFGSQIAMDAHNEWMEHFQYGLIKASVQVAKEYYPAPRFDYTTYSNGIMPIDRYNKHVDEFVANNTTLNWKSLRLNVKRHGMANCALSMVPPSETSSVIGNMTSGMEPIKNLVTVKGSKTNIINQFAPEAIKLSQYYDFAFDRKITKDYLKHVAITQKWIDLSISTQTFYNPELYENEKVSQRELIEDIFFAKYYGIKTMYYNNTKSSDDEIDIAQNQGCSSGGCEV
ncbi:MAG: ribonucleoside-diphosphate reductase subunit alpha [Sulfurimonas sp.]|nr:ribonucleoside-diphosphate reductase subunit alpha [Sulfurimonas sp.]